MVLHIVATTPSIEYCNRPCPEFCFPTACETVRYNAVPRHHSLLETRIQHRYPSVLRLWPPASTKAQCLRLAAPRPNSMAAHRSLSFRLILAHASFISHAKLHSVSLGARASYCHRLSVRLHDAWGRQCMASSHVDPGLFCIGRCSVVVVSARHLGNSTLLWSCMKSMLQHVTHVDPGQMPLETTHGAPMHGPCMHPSSRDEQDGTRMCGPVLF